MTTSPAPSTDIRSASRRQIFSWALFDFANTGFYVIIITLIFPIYFNAVIAGGNNAYWGRTISASMLITALFGPLIGSIADITNRKKFFLALLTVACVIATIGLYFTSASTFWLAVILLIIANVGFEGGTIFYDAFLPEITTPYNYGRVSGYGFALGYLGSFAVLIIILPLLSGSDGNANVPITFLIAAGFFALFSLPLFFLVREQHLPRTSTHHPLVEGYYRLYDTFTHLNQYDSVKRFLLSFFVYNDSILTVIFFSGIFAQQTLGLSLEDLIYFFMLVQGTAFIGSLLFGLITNKVGPRQAIAMTLLIWLGIIASAAVIESRAAFFILGGIAGTALGSSQSTSRAMMALLTPVEKKTEFFGFYNGFFGKASAVIGPLIFGEASSMFGQRPAILIIGGLMLLGFFLLMRVPDIRAQKMTVPDSSSKS
ncbi:MAG: MFS transporter [bacterium]